ARGDTVVAGGVNAAFFLFDPPGVPTGAHVHDGRVVTGPGARPVFAVDSGGGPWIGVLSVAGFATWDRDSMAIASWNRIAPAALAWLDARYGSPVDTLSGSIRVVLSAEGLVRSIDTTRRSITIPSSGGVLVLGPRAPATVRERFLLASRSGRFAVAVRLTPIHPIEAVGGFPVLVRDSVEVAGLDSAGAPTFAPVRHPRTIVGVGAGGRRLLLITVDGRQPGHSAGTTNRESAAIALALGATQAINLDGGGSTAMVIARGRGDSTAYEVVNKPSDAQGERAVGNALVVVRHRRAYGGC
ncbi:MAG TPA: phosphodiester glycosidase family protein, partial [Gemmatimonadaceae bacterium]